MHGGMTVQKRKASRAEHDLPCRSDKENEMRQIECAMRMSLVATACGLLLAGCGGGGSSGNSEGRLQTINFQYPGGNTLLNGPTVLHATATSGLPVTFTSGTPNTCTVSGDQLTLVAAGECLVIANQGGGSAANGVQWAAADRVSQLFNVLRHAQAAVLPMAAVFRGTSETVALSAVTDAGLAASYTSNSPAVCTVSGTVLTVTGLGLCDLTVTAPADTNYAALATGVSIPVDSLPPFVVRSMGAVQRVALATVDTDGQALSYTSTTPTVCTVSGSDLQLLAKGSCQVSATSAGGSSAGYSISIDPRFFSTGFNLTLNLTAEYGELNLSAGSAVDGWWCGGSTPSNCNLTVLPFMAVGAYDIKPLKTNPNWGADSVIDGAYYSFQVGAPRTRVLNSSGAFDHYELTPFEAVTETTLFVTYGVDPTLYATGGRVFVKIQTGHAVPKVEPDGSTSTCYVTVSQLPDMASADLTGRLLQLSEFAVTENCGLPDMPKTEGWMFNWGVTAESKAAALAEIRTHGIRLLEFSPNSMNLTTSAPRADGTIPAKTDADYTLTNDIAIFGPITVQ
jgi:hypothetical protein